ncbi:MAG: hypothetical protein K9G70_11440 [Prolixibacteraceae bacterium]|nr:hypothetical protein [Prolixibacteraceae bacterium]
MKIIYSSSKINSFGGINFANSIIVNKGICSTIDQLLGSRGIRAGYGYSDLFRSYLLMTLCGGECAEDITEHFRGELAQVKDFYVCSADTLLRMQKELSTQKETFVSDTGITHEFNVNMAMNNLEANSEFFYIRAQRCANLLDQIKDISDWKTVTIGFKEYQVASIQYAPFGWDKTYRYVVSKEKNTDGQGDLFTVTALRTGP